jgi:hypothetical protein
MAHPEVVGRIFGIFEDLIGFRKATHNSERIEYE